MADLQTLRRMLLGSVIDLARTCTTRPPTETTPGLILAGLHLSDDAVSATPEQLIALNERIQQNKFEVSPNCATCASPCGKNADYDLRRLDDAPEDYVVHGPNQMTALPMEVPVSYQEIAHCLDKSISKIEAAILSALEQTPPELYADIVKNGIYLAGGGAMLRGLDKRLRDKMNIQFHIAEDPLHAVAKGTGVALKNIEKFNFLIR